MNAGEYLDALRDEGRAFADACDANLAADVPACPGWSVADLVWHLGRVHRFWRVIAEGRLQDRPAPTRQERPPGSDLLDWYRDGLYRLHAVLSEADPAEPVWTWTDDKTVGFVRRRMAHETAVHRWDAEDAAHRRHDIDARLARDGIDEFLEHFLGSERASPEPVGGTVHLHAADQGVPGDGEWLVEEGPDGFTVSQAHAKGDAALRATSSDLLLALWGRRPAAELQVFGDAGVAQRFLAHTDLT